MGMVKDVLWAVEEVDEERPWPEYAIRLKKGPQDEALTSTARARAHPSPLLKGESVNGSSFPISNSRRLDVRNRSVDTGFRVVARKWDVHG